MILEIRKKGRVAESKLKIKIEKVEKLWEKPFYEHLSFQDKPTAFVDIFCKDELQCFEQKQGNILVNPDKNLSITFKCSDLNGRNCLEHFSFEWYGKTASVTISC